MDNNKIMQLAENYLTNKGKENGTKYLEQLLEYIASGTLTEEQYVNLYVKITGAEGVRLAIISAAPRMTLIKIYQQITLSESQTSLSRPNEKNYIIGKLDKLTLEEAGVILTDSEKYKVDEYMLKLAIQLANLNTLIEFIKNKYMVDELKSEISSKLSKFDLSEDIANQLWNVGDEDIKICVAKYVSKENLLSYLCFNQCSNVYLMAEIKRVLKRCELTEGEAQCILDLLADREIRLFASKFVSKEYILKNLPNEDNIEVVESFLEKFFKKHKR